MLLEGGELVGLVFGFLGYFYQRSGPLYRVLSMQFLHLLEEYREGNQYSVERRGGEVKKMRKERESWGSLGDC